MTKLERLKKEAREAAKLRGHALNRFETRSVVYPTQASARCGVCDMTAHVDSDPAPNGIDISGEAVALDCGSN